MEVSGPASESAFLRIRLSTPKQRKRTADLSGQNLVKFDKRELVWP